MYIDSPCMCTSMLVTSYDSGVNMHVLQSKGVHWCVDWVQMNHMHPPPGDTTDLHGCFFT